MESKSKYFCSKCGRAVIVNTKGDIIRVCKCGDDSGVLAQASAITKGIGGLKPNE
jgi:hypothetical protein